MLPGADQLLAISQQRSGNLVEVPFAILLRALNEHGRSAVLEIRKGPLEKSVVIEDGVPVDCQSNLAHERLGRFLISQGRLSETEFATSFSEALKDEVPLGQVLIRRGHIAPSELYRVLQQNLAKKLLDVFSWHEGEFELSRDMPTVDSALKIRVHQLILTGVTRFASQSQIDMVVMGLLGKKLALHPSPPVPMSELRFSVPQQRLMESLRAGPKEMSELAAAAKVEPDELSRLIYAFGILGLVGTEEEVAAAEPAEEPRTTQAFQIPVAADDTLLSEDDLVQLFLAHRAKDPFELLAVEENGAPQDFERSYLEFAQRLRPWAYGEEGGLREKASAIFLAAARAYAVLADRDRRESLIAERRQEAEPVPAIRDTQPMKKAGPMRIETDLLDPEAQYSKAQKLIEQGQYRESLQYLQFASDCDPQNGLYRAEHAYYDYLADPSNSERALEELEQARRIDPSCVLAVFYTGEILRDLQRFDEAEPLLEASIKPMAPDRRPIDALRELRKQAKKKRR